MSIDDPVTPPEMPEVVPGSLRGKILTGSLLAVAIGIILFFQFFTFPLLRETLGSSTPQPADMATLKIVFTFATLLGVLSGLVVAALGMKILRHRQMPPPDSWVWRDTAVQRGPKAIRTGKIYIALGGLACIVCIGFLVYLWHAFDRMAQPFQLPPGVTLLPDPPRK
jgi:sterol desaturase/sphingolipid hydroxylase (fatty acid hydroxylase superfamily)